MKIKNYILFAACVFIVSCQSFEFFEEQKIPEWVEQVPVSNDSTQLFVAKGTQFIASVANDLIRQVEDYFGILETIKENDAKHDLIIDYEIKIRNMIIFEQKTGVPGLEIIDQYSGEIDNGIQSKYMLVKYDRELLNDARDYWQLQMHGRIEPVDTLLDMGNMLEKEGDYMGALAHYLNALSSATSHSHMYADKKARDAIHRSRNLISRWVLVPENNDLVTQIYTEFSTPFIAALMSGMDGRPIGDAPILISYKKVLPNGEIGTITDRASTDGDGKIYFSHPPPDFLGIEAVAMWLDIDRIIQESQVTSTIAYTPISIYNELNELREIAPAHRAIFNYTISPMEEFATDFGLVFTEVDIAGNLQDTNVIASKILERIAEGGYDIESLSYVPVLSFGQYEINASIITAIQKLFSGEVEYLLYGVAYLKKFEEFESGVRVTIADHVSIVELESGIVKWSDARSHQTTHGSIAEAIDSSFLLAGNDIVDRMEQAIADMMSGS